MFKQSHQSLSVYIAICGKLISEKLQFPEISAWQNSHYVSLSDAITKETKTYISKNTLKRFFGKMKTDQFYFPQRATLDAIAIFIGYGSWENFAAVHDSYPSEEVSENRINTKTIFRTRSVFLIFSLVIICLIFVLYKIYFRNDRDLRISCKNPLGLNSHSAIFELIGADKVSDTSSYSIDFTDRVRIPIKSKDSIFVHHFQTPGWYPVSLYRNEIPLDTALVKVRSIGWAAYVSGNKYEYGRFPLHAFGGKIENMKGFTRKDVASVGVDTVKAFFLNFVNIKPTNINGDNFELLVNVKTSASKFRGDCNSFSFNIYGERDDHYVQVTNRECVAWCDANFSEKVNLGLTSDLSKLGQDLSMGGMVKLRVANRKALLFVDNNLIFSTTYERSLGKISGVRLFFKNIGELYSFSLMDLNTKEKF